MNQIIFRVDANQSIGMGHVMRCLSLADAFLEAGDRCFFIVADDCAADIVDKRGYGVKVLHSDYSSMDEELSLWDDGSADLVIVDSYSVTIKYLDALHLRVNEHGGKVAYLDDVYSFAYPVDILINYNSYASEEEYCKLYRGTEVIVP